MGTPALMSREFAAEYATWMVAPLPFMLPWLLLQHLHKHGMHIAEAGNATHPGAVASAGFLSPFLAPDDWSQDAFLPRLRCNAVLWLTAYSTAWLAYHCARHTAAANFKFNPKMPAMEMVLTEMARSFGGIIVVTAYQVLLLGPVYRQAAADHAEHSAGAGGDGGGGGPPLPELALWAVVTGLWSDVHFYATHRFMHAVPLLYRNVHKVHHRSINTDPWSGLSMHPVEHVVYFSAALLGLVIAVPFWVTNLLVIALIVYPIPSHIGYWPFERHHWEHHTEFNYNYGSSMLFDVLLGTTFEAFEQGKAQTKADRARATEAKRQQELAMEG